MLVLSYGLLTLLCIIMLFRNIKVNIRNGYTWINTFNLTIVNFVFYFLLIPLLILLTKKFSMYHLTDPYIVFSRLLIVNFVFICFFVIGYKIIKTNNKKVNLIYADNKSTKIFDFFVLLLFIIVFIYSFNKFFDNGVNYYISNMWNRILLNRGKGYLILGLTSFSPLAIYYFDKFLRKKQKYLLVYFVITFFIANLMYIILGYRGRSLILILVIGLIYSLRKKTKMITITILVLIILPSYLLLGNIREQVNNNDLSTVTFEMDYEDYLDKAIVSFGVSEYLAIVMDRYRDTNDYQLGKTFISLVTLPIPSQYFENKSYGSGPIISNVISPGVYGINKEGSSSFTLSLIGEFYINFGYWAIPLGGFFFGMIVRFLDLKLFKMVKTGGIYIAPIILLSVGLSNKVLVGEFLGAMSGVLFELVPLYLVIVAEKKLGRNKYYAESNTTTN